MYSVVLTELGVGVFADGKLAKSFGFKDPVRDYLRVRDRKPGMGDLVSYLASLQRGVAVSDEALRSILADAEIDAQMADAAELERIQSAKPEIIAECGFAGSPEDALGKLRKFALEMSSSRVTEASESPDLHVIQTVRALDEVEKMENVLGARMREWYGLHFPELDNVVDGMSGYAKVVLAGRRDSLTRGVFEEAGFAESKVEMLTVIAAKSRGGAVPDEALSSVQSIAQRVLDLHGLRRSLEERLEAGMDGLAPNLTAILGTTVGARMIGRAGSLKKLALMPASTIQVLGAEKALFRALQTGSPPPKHGLLFQHPLVHAAPRWQRGKIARAIAAKAVIAARIDTYGEGLNGTLLEKLNVRVGEIAAKYEAPPPPKPAPERRRGQERPGRGQGRRKGGRERPGPRSKAKKRRQFGRKG